MWGQVARGYSASAGGGSVLGSAQNVIYLLKHSNTGSNSTLGETPTLSLTLLYIFGSTQVQGILNLDTDNQLKTFIEGPSPCMGNAFTVTLLFMCA